MPMKCNTTRAEEQVSIQEVYQSWGSTDIHQCMQIGSEVYNSDRKLSIMQSPECHHHSSHCSQNPSVSELHMVKTNHSKKG